ncbi:CMRF35-like molecule 4 isoform X3, partial [Clarias magur]
GTDAVTTVTGYRGRSVQIKCSYTSGYENYNKYLCRGECSNWISSNDVPVQSGSPAKDSRFSLHDDTTAKVFTVTITDLRPEDGGTYWCAIERTWSDIYTKIQLLVKMDVPVSSTVSQSTHTTSILMSSSVHAWNTHPTTATPLNEINKQTSIPTPHDIPGKPVYIVMGAGAVLFVVAVIIAIYCKIKDQGSETVTQSPRK